MDLNQLWTQRKWILLLASLPSFFLLMGLAGLLPGTDRGSMPETVSAGGVTFGYHSTRKTSVGKAITYMGPGVAASMAPHDAANMAAIFRVGGSLDDAVDEVIRGIEDAGMSGVTVGARQQGLACLSYDDGPNQVKVGAWIAAVDGGLKNCVLAVTKENPVRYLQRGQNLTETLCKSPQSHWDAMLAQLQDAC